MGDYNKDSEKDKDKSIDCLLQELRERCGCSEEDLLDEFEAASNLDIPLPIPEAKSDEFDTIWSRIEQERAESADTTELAESPEADNDKIVRVRFRWKRLAAIGLIACLIAASGSVVAMGRKSYFYRERKDELFGDSVILNNDMNKVAVNGEEEAYALVEKNLNIKPIKLGYMPENMEFTDVQVGEGAVYIKFSYQNAMLYLMQTKSDREASYNNKSDLKLEEEESVYNKWLREDLKIREDIHKDGQTTYETSLITGGACYRLIGTLDKELFQKIIEELSF